MSDHAITGETAVPAKPAPGARTPPLMDHAYDGIREYDNPLPGWWRYTFYATIVFAVGYWFWFHAGGPGRSELDQYAAARKDYDQQRATRRAAEGDVDEVTLAGMAHDAATVSRGAAVFTQYCVPCHTDNGRGLVGPNLTDDFQKHGHDRTDLFRTVSGGAPGTAMIAWSETLSASQVLDVVAFVSNLRGTNVPDGKAPEGDPVGAFDPP
jgi:cytochrome c oxidase cbb3-type subunit III